MIYYYLIYLKVLIIIIKIIYPNEKKNLEELISGETKSDETESKKLEKSLRESLRRFHKAEQSLEVQKERKMQLENEVVDLWERGWNRQG